MNDIDKERKTKDKYLLEGFDSHKKIRESEKHRFAIGKL